MAGKENTTVSGKSTTTSTAEATPNGETRNTNVNDENTTVTEEVAPAVEHETVKKQHETQEQTVIDKEKHQDHYHTTIQPLKDQEVLPTQENEVVAEREFKDVDHRDGGVRAKVQGREAGFEDTRVEEKSEVRTQAPMVEGEHVHHHLHETIQPVIEKGEFRPIAQISQVGHR